MAKEMLCMLEKEGAMPDIIIPVPITEKRKRFRSFNQSVLLAQEMQELAGGAFDVRTDIVLRIKERPPQAKLKREERLVNLKGIFALNNKESLIGKKVLILDDVFTTGSTVSEVAKTLKPLNPQAIMVLTFAKTCLNSDNF